MVPARKSTPSSNKPNASGVSASFPSFTSTPRGQLKVPFSNRLVITHSPLPSQYNVLTRLRRLLVNTNKAPEHGSSLGGDSPPSVRVAFETKNVTIQQMVRFYRDHFVNSGWTEVEPRTEYQQDIWYKFRKGKYTVSLIGYEGGKWGGMQCVAVIRTYNTPFYR